MRESRTYGSVRGAPSNGRPYRDRAFARHDEGGAASRQRVITSGSWYYVLFGNPQFASQPDLTRRTRPTRD